MHCRCVPCANRLHCKCVFCAHHMHCRCAFCAHHMHRRCTVHVTGVCFAQAAYNIGRTSRKLCCTCVWCAGCVLRVHVTDVWCAGCVLRVHVTGNHGPHNSAAAKKPTRLCSSTKHLAGVRKHMHRLSTCCCAHQARFTNIRAPHGCAQSAPGHCGLGTPWSHPRLRKQPPRTTCRDLRKQPPQTTCRDLREQLLRTTCHGLREQ